MVAIVKKIARMANEWNLNRIQRTIDIGELRRQGHYHKLANKMVGTVKQTILTTARKYFKVFEWDAEASKLRVWRGSRAAQRSTQLVKRAISALSRT
jgi:hypothetical protein